MTITTTQIGSKTTQITISGETSSTNIISAIDAAIVNAGWIQYDVSLSNLRVYRALNADNTSYKYFGLHIDPIKRLIGTTSWESWNLSTHTGTNEVWTANRGFTMGYAMNSTDIIVMASSRWCIIQTYIRNSASFWSGVIELVREFPEDTTAANYPCWAWVNSQLIGNDYDVNLSVTTAGTFRNFSLPRTRTGLTGQAASFQTSLVTPFDCFGYGGNMTSTNLGLSFGQARLGQVPEVYPWDTTKKIVHTLRPRINLAETHGRMYGLKATAAQGYTAMNIASLPVDSDQFYSSSGVATDHWLLSTHMVHSSFLGITQSSITVNSASVVSTTMFSYQTSPANAIQADLGASINYNTTLPAQFYVGAPVSFAVTSGSLPSNIIAGTIYYISKLGISNNFSISATYGGQSIALLGTVSGSTVVSTNYSATSFNAELSAVMPANVQDAVGTGLYYYVGTVNGLFRVDNATFTSVQITAVTDLSILFVISDGRYIWAAGETKLWRIDTQNSDAVTSVAIPGGAGAIYWSGLFVWCGTRSEGTPTSLYKVNLTTLVATVVSGISTSSTGVVGSIVGDNSGNVYTAPSNMFTGNAMTTFTLTKIVETTNVTTTYSNIIDQTGVNVNATGLMWDGQFITVAVLWSNTYLTVKRIDPTVAAAAGVVGTTLSTFNIIAASKGITSMTAALKQQLRLSRFGAALFIGMPCSVGSAAILLWNQDLGSSTQTQFPISTVSNFTSQSFVAFDGNRLIGAPIGQKFTELNNVVRPSVVGFTAGMMMIPK
jgi:hypothetical protein